MVFKGKGKFLYSAVSSQDCSKLLTIYSLAEVFNQTPSGLLRETMLQLMGKDYFYTKPPLSTTRYSFIQLSNGAM